MLAHRSTIPLWIIAISLVVIVLWMIGVPAMVVTAIRVATAPPPVIPATPTPDPEAWTPKWAHVCAGLNHATYRPDQDYLHWLYRWGQLEGHTIYLIGRVLRQHPQYTNTFYVQTAGEEAWLDGLHLPDGVPRSPNNLIEVAGVAKAPVIDEVTGTTLPRVAVVLWRDLTGEQPRCPRVAKQPPPPSASQSNHYRWEN